MPFNLAKTAATAASVLTALAVPMLAAAPAHADTVPSVTQLAYTSKSPCGSGYQQLDVYSSQYGYLVYVCYR